MALSGQIVDFVGLNLLNDANQIGAVRQIAIVKREARMTDVRVLVQMIDPVRVEERRAPLDAVNPISLRKQQFGKIGAILSRNAGNERNFVVVHV